MVCACHHHTGSNILFLLFLHAAASKTNYWSPKLLFFSSSKAFPLAKCLLNKSVGPFSTVWLNKYVIASSFFSNPLPFCSLFQVQQISAWCQSVPPAWQPPAKTMVPVSQTLLDRTTAPVHTDSRWDVKHDITVKFMPINIFSEFQCIPVVSQWAYYVNLI